MSKSKNPNLIPQVLADYIRKLEADRKELLHVLNIIANDPLPRYSRDTVSNLPIREIMHNVIRKMEKEQNESPTHDEYGYPIKEQVEEKPKEVWVTHQQVIDMLEG